MKLCMQRYGFLYKQKNARSSRNGNKKRMMVNVCIIVNSLTIIRFDEKIQIRIQIGIVIPFLISYGIIISQ